MRTFLFHLPSQLVMFTALTLSLSVFWWLVINDERAIQQDSAARVEDQMLTIERFEQQAAITARILDDYRHNLDEIGRFRKSFLERKEARIVRISEFLAERANARGVALDRVSYNSGRSRERDLDLYLTQLPLKGRYRDIRSFIEDIETSDMFLIIRELSLADEAGNEGAVSMQLTLATYFEAGP